MWNFLLLKLVARLILLSDWRLGYITLGLRIIDIELVDFKPCFSLELIYFILELLSLVFLFDQFLFHPTHILIDRFLQLCRLEDPHENFILMFVWLLFEDALLEFLTKLYEALFELHELSFDNQRFSWNRFEKFDSLLQLRFFVVELFQCRLSEMVSDIISLWICLVDNLLR